MGHVPCVEISGLSAAQKKAYRIADNKIALNAGWDIGMLRLELGDLKGLDFDLALTGFSPQELRLLMVGDGHDVPEPPA